MQEIHKDCGSPRECVLRTLTDGDRKQPILLDVLARHWGYSTKTSAILLQNMIKDGDIYCCKPTPEPDANEHEWIYGIAASEVEQPRQDFKADGGKPKMGFLLQIPDAMAGMADVFEHGAKKYGVGTWDRVEIDRYIHALGRHFFALGPDAMNKDPESGLLNIDHVLWNAAVISQMLHKWQKECPLGKAVADGNLGGK